MKRQDRNAFRKGMQSELVVLLALQRLRSLGVISRFSFKDEPGVDCRLTLPQGIRMTLQVKSSERGRRVHYQRYPNHPCVVVRHASQNIKEVCKDIRDCIRNYRSSL